MIQLKGHIQNVQKTVNMCKLQEQCKNPCFKAFKNVFPIWTDRTALVFLCVFARRGRCETDNHVVFEQNVSALKHVLIYSSLCLQARNTSTPYNLVGKHITQASVFWGFSYLLRVKPQRAVHNSSETCIKVKRYSQQICTIHKTRPSGGILKKYDN